MSILKKIHWLEIVEYITLLATLMAILGGLTFQWWTPTVFLLFISLLLNLINRLRFQILQRQKILALAKQLQKQFQSEIQALKPLYPVVSFRSPLKTPENSALDSFTHNLGNLEQSVTGIIQYLETHRLAERLKRLESLNEQLTIQGQAPIDSSIPSLSSSASSPLEMPLWIQQHTLTAHQDAVSSLALIAQGTYFISGSWDQTLKIWELETGELKESLTAHDQPIISLETAQISSEVLLASGGFDQKIHLWSVKSDDNSLKLNLEKTLTAHTGSIHSLAILDDILISGSYDQTVKQWDLLSGKMIASSLDPSGAIYAIAVSNILNLVASGGGDGKISLLELETGSLLGYLSGNLSSILSLAISPDGDYLAAGCVDGNIKIWLLEPENFSKSAQIKPLGQLNGHQGHVKALCFSQDSQFLYSGGADGYIHIWHFSQENPIVSLKIGDVTAFSSDAVLSLALSPDERYLIVGHDRGIIAIWERQ